MFETSVFKPQAAAAHGRISLLTVSVAFHSLAVVGVVVASVATVRFPKEAPRETSILSPIPVVSIPMPKGTPDATTTPVKPQPQPAQPVTRVATAPPTDVAPSTVPNTTPQLASTDAPATSTSGTGEPGNGPYGQRGVANGSDIGIDIGQTQVSEAPVPDVIYRPGADVKPAVVIQRVDPLYPRVAIAARMSGTVVIHCVIDKSGNIREPQVMSSTFTAFNQPAIDAVQQWRFSPGTMRGKPVDTYFELTVRFSMR